MISFKKWVEIKEDLRFTNLNADEEKIMDDWRHMTGEGIMPGKAIHMLAQKYDMDPTDVKKILNQHDPDYMKDVKTALDMDEPINYDPSVAA